MWETSIFDIWEKEMAIHSSILAWKIPRTEEFQKSLVGCSPWCHMTRARTHEGLERDGLLAINR